MLVIVADTVWVRLCELQKGSSFRCMVVFSVQPAWLPAAGCRCCQTSGVARGLEIIDVASKKKISVKHGLSVHLHEHISTRASAAFYMLNWKYKKRPKRRHALADKLHELYYCDLNVAVRESRVHSTTSLISFQLFLKIIFFPFVFRQSPILRREWERSIVCVKWIIAREAGAAKRLDEHAGHRADQMEISESEKFKGLLVWGSHFIHSLSQEDI